MAATAVSVSGFSKPSLPVKPESRANVLLVDPDPQILDYLSASLGRKYAVRLCRTCAQATAAVKDGFNPDIAFIDSILPDGTGLKLLGDLRRLRPALPIVMISCTSEPRLVVQAVRSGARDFIQKPLRPSDLEQLIEQVAISKPPLGAAEESSELAINENVSFVIANRRMKEIRAQCALVAKVDLPVLVLGESGTGKEVVAQYIHKVSARGQKTFLKVNCAAMPADLLESELFGYEQGAFTGAIKSKPGKFELCNGGTILLDEIGEMPPALQAKMLQVLQDGCFSRLGSRSTIQVDVRVIAATNIEMKLAIAEKRFREDLFYRLNGFTLNLPPLRERKDEIPLLIEHFTHKLAKRYDCEPLPITPALLSACTSHHWPGNLRELENFVKRWLVLADEHVLLQEFIPNRVEPISTGETSGLKDLVRSMKDDAEAIAIARALELTRWNRKQAANELKISYKALLYKIRQYNLFPPQA